MKRSAELSIIILLIIACGCRDRQEAVIKEMVIQLQPGMNREQVGEILGGWGKRHFFGIEESHVPEGRT